SRTDRPSLTISLRQSGWGKEPSASTSRSTRSSPEAGALRHGRNEKESGMNAMMTSARLQRKPRNGHDLLRAGRSLRVLAITVIVLLSVGILLLSLTDWLQGGELWKIIRSQNDAVLGFALLMLLTVGYLIGKGVSTTREQKVMMAQLLDEE